MKRVSSRSAKKQPHTALLAYLFDAMAERAAVWAEAIPVTLIDEMHAARASVAHVDAMREQLSLRLRGRRALNGAEWLPGLDLAANAVRAPGTVIVPPERLHA